MTKINEVLIEVAMFNERCNYPINQWLVVPELLFHESEGTTTFVKEVWEVVKQIGERNQHQSPEERGAVGEAYFVDGFKLYSHFNLTF